MTDTTTLAPTDAEIDALVKATYGDMRGGPLQGRGDLSTSGAMK